MTRVLAAALLSVMTLTASAGLAGAATPAATSGSSVGTSAPIASTHKATPAKPVTKKKATTSSVAAKPAVKTQETGKAMAKPHS